MLKRIQIPGLFITGTDTGVGKTLVAAAIADWFVRHGAQPAVSNRSQLGASSGGRGSSAKMPNSSRIMRMRSFR